MKYIKEMAEVIKKGKKLTVNGTPLRNVKLEDIGDNFMIYHCEKGNFLYPAGFTMIWFIDNDENMKAFLGDTPLSTPLMFPMARNFNMNSSPINDIWKKNDIHQKNIIGAIQAYVTDGQLYVDMMSVRNGYNKNGINKHMIEKLIQTYDIKEVKFSKPTDMGKEFIKKYYPTAKIEGTLSNTDLKELVQKAKQNDSLNKYTYPDIVAALKMLKIDTSSLNNIRGASMLSRETFDLFKKVVKEYDFTIDL